KLGLSYTNIAGLHKCVDSIWPRAGEPHRSSLGPILLTSTFNDHPDKEFVLRHCDIVEVVKSLWGDPSLAKHLVYRPKSVFQDAKHIRRAYSEMWSGKWWQYTQDKLPVGATVAPLIIATDKTQLTQFSGSKQAYPVYLTLGNIPRGLRRKPSQQACVLLAYLPVEKLNKDQMIQREATGRYHRLFHEAMRQVMAPLITAGKEGVDMASADGEVRCVHPILASYVADFPEQCLVACSKSGTCPKCRVLSANLGEEGPFERRTPKWTLGVMKEARESS
ncbi:hypothetical protein BDP27DRAFT_1145888, partial [Rhodocollybia butyracea]